LPNWKVRRLEEDDPLTQEPDKLVSGKRYWFFKYFPPEDEVDIIDIGEDSWFLKIEKKLKFYIRQAFQAFRRRNDYDLVISHGAQSGLVYQLLTSFTRRNPKYLLFDIGGLNGARMDHVQTPLIRFALRKKPYIIVHSSQQIDWYEENYPELAPRVRYIPFGADCDFFMPLHLETGKTIVTFGYKKRDRETLLQAWDALEDHHGFRLIVVGNPTLPQSRTEGKDIESLPTIPIDQLTHMMAACAFIVLPLPELPYSYGQMSLLHAMAVAKPLIVSRTTSTIDYITDAPKGGVVPVEPGNVAEMKEALQHMMGKSPALLEALGETNRLFVTEKFTGETMAKQIHAYIDEIFSH